MWYLVKDIGGSCGPDYSSKQKTIPNSTYQTDALDKDKYYYVGHECICDVTWPIANEIK